MTEAAGSRLELALAYVDAVTDSRASLSHASRVIRDALDEGWGPTELLVEVLPEALYEIGRRWQDGRASVADEHLTTSIVQDTLRELSAALPRAERRGKSVLVAAVDGELHAIGPRILADLLEADGWDVLYLGAATPPAALAQLLEQRNVDAIALSATLSTHLGSLREAVGRVRSGSRPDTYILIGGHACRHLAQPAETIGANACELRADAGVMRLAEFAERR
ncbi:MAG TPA: cobalamin-dependent protein [Candidatus Limnocylindrales bacterium]|nr:cobalamin-dependent protein [Candidatus Limnocylindrales bacterium]